MHPVKKLSTDSAGIVECGCNHYPKKADTVQKSTKNEKKNKDKAGGWTRIDAQYPASIDEKTQEAVEAPAKKTEKRNPDKFYQGILTVPETGNISLFKSRLY